LFLITSAAMNPRWRIYNMADCSTSCMSQVLVFVNYLDNGWRDKPDICCEQPLLEMAARWTSWILNSGL
jgi:hypothetical protein